MLLQSLSCQINAQVQKAFGTGAYLLTDTALATASSCFETWRRTTFSERIAIVAQAAVIMRARVDEFARPVAFEMGTRMDQARTEVALGADILDYYAKNAERYFSADTLESRLSPASVPTSPFGVLLGLQPSDARYQELARFAAPNLAAGNVVLVKHAGRVPLFAMAFENLWREAGAPDGTYTTV